MYPRYFSDGTVPTENAFCYRAFHEGVFDIINQIFWHITLKDLLYVFS